MELKDRIIVALDVDNLEKAKPLVEILSPYVHCFKVGLELLTSVGAPQVVKFIHQAGGQVFFDGKFHDIPNTIAAASRAISRLEVKMFNVHASSGKEAMINAVQNKGNSKLLAVTILTALDEESCNHIYGVSVASKVRQFALDASEAGVDGLVCSPKDLSNLLQDESLKHLMKITPGVRPTWADAQDQKRVFTPREAILAGATSLVIGRPITRPPREIKTPVEAIRRILDEISSI